MIDDTGNTRIGLRLTSDDNNCKACDADRLSVFYKSIKMIRENSFCFTLEHVDERFVVRFVESIVSKKEWEKWFLINKKKTSIMTWDAWRDWDCDWDCDDCWSWYGAPSNSSSSVAGIDACLSLTLSISLFTFKKHKIVINISNRCGTPSACCCCCCWVWWWWWWVWCKCVVPWGCTGVDCVRLSPLKWWCCWFAALDVDTTAADDDVVAVVDAMFVVATDDDDDVDDVVVDAVFDNKDSPRRLEKKSVNPPERDRPWCLFSTNVKKQNWKVSSIVEVLFYGEVGGGELVRWGLLIIDASTCTCCLSAFENDMTIGNESSEFFFFVTKCDRSKAMVHDPTVL